MKIIILFILSGFSFLNYCQSTKLLHNKAISQKYFPDTSVYNIKLADKNSVSSILGEVRKEQYIEDHDFPYVLVCNKNRSQFLKLIFHSGNVVNEFDEMEVGYNGNNSCNSTFNVNDIEFKTSNNIRLGMSVKDLKQILISENLIEQNIKDTLVIKTLITDAENAFLRRYNMPSYESVYKFYNDSLFRIKFGFTYP